MGSYASTQNNTSGNMFCKYGPDLEVAELILNIIGGIAGFIPEVGEGIELVAEIGETVIKIMEIANEIQMSTISGNIQQWFSNNGYSTYSPNNSDESPKVSLSLVMTSHCGLLTPNGTGTLEIRVGDMTVFSGATANSVNSYNVTDCPWGETTASEDNLARFGLKKGDNIAKNPEALAEIRKHFSRKREIKDAKHEVQHSAEPITV